MLALLTLPVLLYQGLFVGVMWLAWRGGPRVATIMLVLALAWTATHLFFPPLMLLQALVILGSWFWFRHQRRA